MASECGPLWCVASILIYQPGRGNYVLFVNALVGGHQPQDAVEGTDSQGAMIWNRDALRGWFICLQDDMTTLVMDLAIVQCLQSALTTARPERSRGTLMRQLFHHAQGEGGGGRLCPTSCFTERETSITFSDELIWLLTRSVQNQVERGRDRRSVLAGNDVPDVLRRFHHAGGTSTL